MQATHTGRTRPYGLCASCGIRETFRAIHEFPWPMFHATVYLYAFFPGAAAAPGRAACLLLNDGRKRFSGAFAAKETARIRSSWANMSARRFSSDVKNSNLISTLGEPIDCDTSTANDRKQHSCGDEESSLRAAFTCSLYSRGCY